MKHSPLALIATFIGISMISTQSRSQTSGSDTLSLTDSLPNTFIGLTFNLNRNYHSGGFRIIDVESFYPFEDGTGWGFAVGLSAEFLPSTKGSWGIIPRITFDQRPGEFRQELPNVKVLLPNPVDPSQPEIVDQTVSTTSDITYSLINAEILYKHEIFVLDDLRVGILAGPAFQYILSGTNRQVQDLHSPENARFINSGGYPTENDGSRLIFFDGDIPDRASSRLSIKTGVQGELRFFDNQWALIPGIYYDYGLTDVVPSENWQVHTASLQVDLRHAF